jgi:hypothetical protein
MFCAARGRGGVLISADGHMALGFTAPIPKRVAQMSMGRAGQGLSLKPCSSSVRATMVS